LIDWTRVRLTRWGNWCKGGRRTGYPTAAAFVHANEGGRGSDTGCDMPDDIQEVEDAVRHMSHELAGVIIQVYARTGPLWLKAIRLEVSRRTLRRRLTIAEEQIDKWLRVTA
jgi:hypothetical protein